MEKELKKLLKKLEKNKEYKVYLQITPYTLWYMDKLGMEYNRDAIEEKLSYFSVSLKALDLEIEKDKVTGKEYLDVLIGKKSTKKSLGFYLAKKLRRYVKTAKSKDLFKKLCKTVLKEKKSKNINELIKNREKTGDYLAEATKELIKEDIKTNNKKFDLFLHESMKMNQLMDSYVDLEEDYEKGELKFKPTIKDRNKLRIKLLKDTLRNLRKFPLTGAFLISGIIFLKKMKKKK